MVNVDIDIDLYGEIKKAIKKDKYNYASIKFFVQKAIYNELVNFENSKNNFDESFSKLKELIKDNPQLMSKINEIYNKESKRIKEMLKND